MFFEVKNLTRAFGALRAVDNVSFEIEKGAIYGIAGPNGAGKTTVFNLISGLLSGAGEMILDGISIARLRPDQICHNGVARTFQIPQVFTTKTVRQNVGIGARFGRANPGDGKAIERTVDEVVDFVGLHHLEDTVAETLDLYGMRLTMVAAALATKPKLLLLDEPIAGLSPTESMESVALFRRINSELGVTIIIIEHLMNVLAEICGLMMIMQNGAKVVVGPPKEITEDLRVIEIYLGRGPGDEKEPRDARDS